MSPRLSATRQDCGSRARQRGMVLITVLLMMLVFLTAGGAAVLITRNTAAYQKNREWAMQAMFAAEGALHKTVTLLMRGDAVASIDITNESLDAGGGYGATMDAIIEITASPIEFRIYTRGSSGTNWLGGKVVKFMRAYVRADAANHQFQLMDWQEITRSVIVERAANSAQATKFQGWL